MDEEHKHPVLIPKNSPLTALILHSIHEETLHGGIKILLSTLRQKYWIIGARDKIRQFVRDCVKYSRFNRKMSSQFMGDLPSE